MEIYYEMYQRAVAALRLLVAQLNLWRCKEGSAVSEQSAWDEFSEALRTEECTEECTDE